MKLYYENDKGEHVLLKEVKTLNPNASVIFVRLTGPMKDADMAIVREGFEKATGKTIVVLGPQIGEVFTM